MATGFVWHERYMWHDTGSQANFLPAGGWTRRLSVRNGKGGHSRLKALQSRFNSRGVRL